MPVTVAVVQFAPRKGAVQANLDRIAEHVLQAVAEGAQIVALPEACTTGYFLEGGVVELAMTSKQLVHELQSRVKGKLDRAIEVVIGFYESFGGNLYNSAVTLGLGPDRADLRQVYRKFFLPTYGVFDEERFVSRGTRLGLVETSAGPSAMLICEDVWHSVLPTLTAVAGAQVLFIPSASPARGFSQQGIENRDRYERLVRGISEEHGIFCVLAQLVGFEGGKGFVGGSMITSPMGNVLVQAPVGQEAIILAELDHELVQIARAQTPLISDLQSAWPNIRSIVDMMEFK